MLGRFNFETMMSRDMVFVLWINANLFLPALLVASSDMCTCLVVAIVGINVCTCLFDDFIFSVAPQHLDYVLFEVPRANRVCAAAA